MTTTTPLDERIITSVAGALELYSIHLGRNLGLYQALGSPRTVTDLAATAGIGTRYCREWLEQQAVAGFVTVDDPNLGWDHRRYRLTEGQYASLADPDDLRHASPLADMVVGIGQVLGAVADAFRTGGGVPYADYGANFRTGMAGANRPAFTHELPSTWLAALPDVTARLAHGGRVADLGCGAGWSTIAVARAFPAADVVGIDADPASIADARANARAAGVDVRFQLADATSLTQGGPYDLVMLLEALHDMSAPVDVLRQARGALASGGAVLVADEAAAESFCAPGEETERLVYGFSVLHCLPATLADEDSAATGAVIRPGLVRAMAMEAGFSQVELSDIDAGFFNLYTLHP